MNINFGDIAKHDISDEVLKSLKKVMYAQDDFGIKKYGKALRQNLNYDWDAMADEEIADYLKYRECARQRKKLVIKILQAGLRTNEPKEFIEVALKLLTVEGTGK